MRDESGQLPNFTDHLHTISRDLVFSDPKKVTLESIVNMTLQFRIVKTTEVCDHLGVG